MAAKERDEHHSLDKDAAVCLAGGSGGGEDGRSMLVKDNGAQDGLLLARG